VTSIALRDPATGSIVECAIDGLSPDDLASFPLDEEICAQIARDIAPCLPEEFLAAYVRHVGEVEAGLQILTGWLEHKARELLGDYYLP